MIKNCYIIAAGDYNYEAIDKKDEDIVIAVDEGFSYCKEYNIIPDIIVGDYDSLGYVPKGKEVIILNPVKNDTDTEAAINIAIERGCKKFYIYGALGGDRFAHSIANIQLLTYLVHKGLEGYIVSNNEICTVINKSISFNKDYKGYISIFSLSSECIGVNEIGLKYELNDYTLKNDTTLGISNEFIGKEAKIDLKSGDLLVIFKKNIDMNKFE